MKTRWILSALCGLLALGGCHRHRGGGGRSSGGVASAAPTTDEERTLYALGLIMGERVSEFNLTRRELAVVQRGFADKVTGARPAVSLDEFGPRLQALAEARQTAHSAVTRREGEAYLARAAAEDGAQRLPSGLVYKEIRAGNGPQPTASDEVTVQYRGTLVDGTEFDSSYSHGEPATFRLNGVIPCWTEGVQRLHVGGKARLVCPPDLAYGDRGQRRIPAGSTLTFEVELISIAPPAAPTPNALGVPTGAPPAPAAPAPAH